MKNLTVAEAGRLGGNKTAEKYGQEHFKDMGTRGGHATAEKHGTEHYSRIGAMGAAALKEKYGADHFQKIGSKGGKKQAEKSKQSVSDVRETETGADPVESVGGQVR